MATVPVVGLLATQVDGRRGFLTAWSAVALLYVVPAVVVPVVTWGRVVPQFRVALVTSVVGWWSLFVMTAGVYLAGVQGWHGGRWLVAVGVAVGLAAYTVTNTWALRMRSGQRDVAIDTVDVLIAAVAVVGPIALFVGEPIVASPRAWLAVPLALAVAGGISTCGTYVLMILRLPPGHRGHAVRRLWFCVVTAVDLAGATAQAVSGFTLPPAPFVALHALMFASAVDGGVHVLRVVPAGLGELPPQRQVRKSVLLAPLVAVSAALVVAIAAWRSEHGWVVATAVGLLAALAVGSVTRLAWLGPETARLYSGVERAAQERRELLVDLMRYLDGERPRAAAKLHEQATALYTAMSLPPGPDESLDALRSDLAHRLDASGQMLSAMRASAADQPERERVATVTKAYVGMLYGDAPQPTVEVAVGDRIVLDWTDEAVAIRVIQLAVGNVWRHASATALFVALAVEGGALAIDVCDDGVGFDPAAATTGSGLAALTALTTVAGGYLNVDSAPGHGTRLHAVLGSGATPRPAPHRRSHLHLVGAPPTPPRQRS